MGVLAPPQVIGRYPILSKIMSGVTSYDSEAQPHFKEVRK
jgi:hypothetical protein